MNYFTTFFTITICVFNALAQNINIPYPEAGSSATAGRDLNVVVQRPNSLTGSTYIGLVLGISHCPTGVCPSDEETLGTVLYTGRYNPQYSTGAEQLGPHQNFTVTIPSTFDSGAALLSATLLQLTGASNFAYLQIVNTTLEMIST